MSEVLSGAMVEDIAVVNLESSGDTSAQTNLTLILGTIKANPKSTEALQDGKIARLLRTMVAEAKGVATKAGIEQNRDRQGYWVHSTELSRALQTKFEIDISEYV